jgi:hypothetical protein
MRNRGTVNVFLRKDIEDRLYDDYSNLIIHYDLKLKDFFMNEYINRASGKVEKLFYEHKLGKCLSSKDLLRAMPHILKDKMIEIAVFLRVMENKNQVLTAPSVILSKQYEKMFNNESYSDFTLLSSDDDEIFVHKNILSIRSPVFEAMVNTKLQEGADKRAKIDDIEPRSLTELIRFIYSGRVNDIDPIAGELLYAASKYDLQDLKPLCAKSLAANISADNALNTFILADLHEEEDLKRFAMEYVRFNYNKVKDNETWKSVTQEQFKSIMDHLMDPEVDGSVNLVTTITIQPRITQPTVIVTANPAAVQR